LSGDDITIWEYVPTDASHPFPAFEVGRQLSLLHAIPLAVAAKALGGPVPSLDAAALRGRVRALELDSMAETGLLAGFHKGELVSLFDGVYSGFQSALAASEPVLLHGDMNEGNVLWGVNPLPVLCDFEAMTRGPWAWDMVNMIVSVARGQSDPSLMALLVQGYGADPSFCPGWSDLCQMRAFNIVTWHMLAAYESGIMNEEAFSLASWLTEGFPGLP
jgi:aminoglycoside/choline kinase family phosphotransferase